MVPLGPGAVQHSFCVRGVRIKCVPTHQASAAEGWNSLGSMLHAPAARMATWSHGQHASLNGQPLAARITQPSSQSHAQCLSVLRRNARITTKRLPCHDAHIRFNNQPPPALHPAVCTRKCAGEDQQWAPVCHQREHTTYANACYAKCMGVDGDDLTPGACAPTTSTAKSGTKKPTTASTAKSGKGKGPSGLRGAGSKARPHNNVRVLHETGGSGADDAGAGCVCPEYFEPGTWLLVPSCHMQHNAPSSNATSNVSGRHAVGDL